MIATPPHTNFSWPTNFGIGLPIKNRYDLKTVKKRFIKYWKKLINIVTPYEDKCITGAYVFIWPVIHIRTLFKLY